MPNAQVIHTGIYDLIMQSGPIAKVVLLLLTAASVVCWAVIFTKWRALKKATLENVDFLNTFWHGKNIDEIFGKSEKYELSPVAAVFKSGYKELKKLGEPDAENIGRALMRASSSEVSTLENHLGILATTASAAPFVGLFGTVWGIMNSFQNIGSTGSASLAVVAPGISEALITTATGLAAAIPAVIAYNHFAGSIRRMAVDMDCFSQDFLNIIRRSGMGKKES